MQTPVQIDFQGMTGTPQLQAEIAAHVAELERRYGRITACRVVMRAPGNHHRTGGLYEVRIHLALPNGREVTINRVDDADERYADLAFALNDAFKRARRRLQDQVRRLQGKVKQHAEPPIGTIVRLDPAGFGFIETADGREVYFHRNSVLGADFADLAVGMRVYFAEEMGDKGPQASTVRLMGKHRLRA